MILVGFITTANFLYFSSLLQAASIFFILLFLVTLGTPNFSVALISLSGFIVIQICALLTSGIIFLGVSIGIIYAGAILVMILFILVLVNNTKFELNTNNTTEFSKTAETLLNGSLLVLFSNFLKNHFLIFSSASFSNFNLFSKNIIENNATFYNFSYSEILNLSSGLLSFSSSFFYILGLYISISSILLLGLLRKLYY